ncbi:MAG: phosphoribosylformylglycinamidine synthase [Prolixibacteraceae bacterium]|jgi:phosphoribosylformylglycinamidine synthase|nr:phosphoribosylformylglycinamidine synthase [Prolixibacteraceae bacterium]
MILFFKERSKTIAVGTQGSLNQTDINKLCWLFGDAKMIRAEQLEGQFVGPRKEMITPWSTNAVEITQNMGINGIIRIEEFVDGNAQSSFDPMLQAFYRGLSQSIFTIDHLPDPVIYIDDISAYNKQEGLALSPDEIQYLEEVAVKIERKLTDSEVFGFSQVNSEHCRHKIFNGTFVIDGIEKQQTLFEMIKKTTKTNPNTVVSAYKDNCSFSEGPAAEQFAPASADIPDYFQVTDIETVLSLKAETHNFPTTVEPFNGAATGTGGEIRDRMAGGKGSFPIAGTAVYMTSYSRNDDNNRPWEQHFEPRKWLYHNPEELLIKASNGASDFGNKFGQPLINGSVLTFEHAENQKKYGYDKVIMQAGGIGYARKEDSLKGVPQTGESVVLLGGDNYRIGMGGGAVSSVDTGAFESHIELNAVQRANPEMQKRAYNTIRSLAESGKNPIVSIHDHGAGGHLNCLSELVEETGGEIFVDQLPVGDPTLSAKEIVGNESQERMGFVTGKENLDWIQRIAERERSPFYVIGETTGDHKFTFVNRKNGDRPIDMELATLFGKPPRTLLEDKAPDQNFAKISYSKGLINSYLEQILQLESVGCKDWLTNKVDRSVTGRIAKQQCAGELQLPLNNLGAVAIDYQGIKGIATSLGHAPSAGLINPAHGSVLSIAEALTNIVWAPLTHGLKGVSLSANWMWPAKNPGENARLYQAVEAASDFACALGINIPTGKDSLSMTQKYKDEVVYAPGTVIISASGEISNLRNIIEPVLINDPAKTIYYIDFSKSKKVLGGSSLGQILATVGEESPTVSDPDYFAKAFQTLQEAISSGLVASGHDISSGGLIVTLLENCFAQNFGGIEADISLLEESDSVKALFSENPGVIVQASDPVKFEKLFQQANVKCFPIGKPLTERVIKISNFTDHYLFEIDELREKWFRPSYLLDKKQCGEKLALDRLNNYKQNALSFNLGGFKGSFDSLGIDPKRRERSGIRAAIIREKGVNGDREMAWSLYLAGFDVKDVHMTDLITGRETLEDISLIVFVGGFSNSDVLGSAIGWAGAFKYNERAKAALENFYKRNDTLSLGVCNGCQLMVALDLIYPEKKEKMKMLHNESHKFESSFLNVDITDNESIMLKTLAGKKLGIWVAHGEGKFSIPESEEQYKIPMKYSFANYPGNPNGSDYNTAAICSADGRHLAMMPHLERAIYPWQWGYYPADRKADQVTPWIEAFVNARRWIEEKDKG